MLLRTYLSTSGQPQLALARAVDVSPVTAHHWLYGRITPREERRKAIAQWSRGAVPVESWDEKPSDAELAMSRASAEQTEPSDEPVASEDPARAAVA